MTSPSEEILARMQKRAAELVEFAKENFKLVLDYSEESICRVEHALDEIQKHIGARAEESKAAVVNLSDGFGAYLGEVLRRKFGGEWRTNLPGFPPDVEGLVIRGTVVVPLRQVFLRITRGSEFNIENYYRKAESVFVQRRESTIAAGAGSVRTIDPAIEMKQKAAEAVEEAKQGFGIELDYSEASLDRLDQALSKLHDLLTDKVPEAVRINEEQKFFLKPVAALRFVAYLGEVFCKTLSAEWRNNIPGYRPDFTGLVAGDRLLGVELRGEFILPGDIIVRCINDPQSWSAKNYYHDAKRTHEVNSAMSSAASLDDRMAICAREAAILARDRYNITLDFSENSVKELERLLTGLHDQLQKSGDPQRPSDQWIAGISVTFGAYLGEVIRQKYGGKWEAGVRGSLPALNVNGNLLTPCRKVSLRILNGPVDSVAFFYSAVRQLLQGQIARPKP